MINLNEFLKECKENPVSLTLQKSKDLGNGNYRILCSIAENSYKIKDINKAIGKLFNNKVSLIANTLRERENNLLDMIVKANLRTKAYNNDTNLKRITANIIADINDNSLWEVVYVNGNKRLVLKEDSDFNKIFEHNNRISTEASLFNGIDLNNGDYVSYFDINDNSLKSGYLIIDEDNNMEVITRELEEIPVIEDQIIDAADLTVVEKNPIVASLEKNDAKKVLDYMKILYKDTDFYNKLDELVGVRVSEGPDGKYSTTMVEASLLEGDYDEIKDKIKDYLINESIEELKTELEDFSSTEETEGIEEDVANTDGDIDFATEEEIIESDVNDMDDSLTIQKEDAFQLTGESEDEELNIVTESDLDEGGFDNVDINEMSNEELINSLKEALELSEKEK